MAGISVEDARRIARKMHGDAPPAGIQAGSYVRHSRSSERVCYICGCYVYTIDDDPKLVKPDATPCCPGCILQHHGDGIKGVKRMVLEKVYQTTISKRRYPKDRGDLSSKA